jgi:amino acid adenylation domain-containing protein
MEAGVAIRDLVSAPADPGAPAVADRSTTLTYAELDARSASLAGALLDAGVGRDDLVGVHLGRTVDYVVAIVAALRAGAAFLPLDPALPALRKERLRAAVDARVVVSALPWPGKGQPLSLDATAAGARPPTSRPRDLAYALFTSGSSGEPRCVLVEGANLLALLRGLDAVAAPPAEPVGSAICPFSFDVSVWEIFSVLYRGGLVRLIDGDDAYDGRSLARTLLEGKVSSAYIPAGMLLDVIEMLEERGDVGALERVLVGVEPIVQSTLQRLRALDRELVIVNGYGPTETTVCATLFEFGEATEPNQRVPIGFPVPGYRVDLVDEQMQRVPAGTLGEVLVGGAGVARGYAADPEATAARFVPDPFATEPGARSYLTGDLARRRDDGAIVFVGRRDMQAKVRGFRVELGEVEAALANLPGVRRAVARVMPLADEQRLVAFAETDGGIEDKVLELALAEELPAHATPDRVIACKRLPLTPNGKLDNRGLEQLTRRRPPLSGPPRPPTTPNEELLAAKAREVLGLAEVGVDDGFVELGGTSLAAMALARAAREATGRQVTGALVLREETIRRLAAALPELDPVGSPEPEVEAEAASPAEAALWTLQQLDPSNRAFLLPVALEIEGDVDAGRIAAALERLVERHEVLRTRFELRDGRVFRVLDRRGPKPHHMEAAGRSWEEIAPELIADGLRQPPTLERAPWRAWLVRLAPERHALALLLHHAIFDGWSTRVLVRDLRVLLDGEEPEASRSPARVEAEGRPSPRRRSLAESYWRRRFADPPTPLALPVDRPRGPRRSSRGDRLVRRLGARQAAGLDALAGRTRSNRFGVLLALVAVLARRYSGSEDLVLCTPVARRDAPGAESVIGYLVNLLPLRIDASGEPPLKTFVERTREELLEAQAHASHPFERVAAEIGAAPSLTTSPLTRLVVVDEVDPGLPVAGQTAAIRALRFEAPTAKYELCLTVSSAGGGIELGWEYAGDLFDRSTIERLARNFEVLVDAAIAADAGAVVIDDLDALTTEERQRLLREFNSTASPAPLDRGLDELVAERVAKAPDAPAVIGAEETLTLAELDARASALAGALREAGLDRGEAVLVRLPRSPAQIVAALAAVKAGGSYVPVDPALPAKRLEAIRRATGARFAVTADGAPPELSGEPLIGLPATATGPPPGPGARGPDSVAYVMFTSGSTGVPKGVAVPDRGVIRLVREQSFMSVDEGDTFMQLSSFSFDAATLEIWGALLNGARLVIPAEETVRDPALLARELERHRVSIGFLNVSLFRRLLDASPQSLRCFHTLLVGGEQVPEALLREATEWLDPSSLLNGYGPTENTTFSCCHRLHEPPPERMAVPVGRPIANSTAYVLDARLRPLPIGAIGEIVVGGAGVAHGYVNDPELTARSFVPDPFRDVPGARLYRTGDLGRVRPDGTIECLGRGDDQVKVRGYRIHLGEIEHLMAEVEGVRRAVALAPVGEEGRQLLGFVEAPPTVSATDIRLHLAANAPSYCVPSHILVLDRFPLNANGKVDRQRLLETRRRAVAPARTVPGGETERQLAEIWASLLRLEQVGVEEPFFEVGGDSLLLVSLRDEIATRLGRRPSLSELLDRPTIRAQAELLDAGAAGDGVDGASTRASERGRRRRAVAARRGRDR